MSSITELSKGQRGEGEKEGLSWGKGSTEKGGPRRPGWRTASIPPTHARVQIAGITAGRLIAGTASNGAAAHGQGPTPLHTNRVSRLFERTNVACDIKSSSLVNAWLLSSLTNQTKPSDCVRAGVHASSTSHHLISHIQTPTPTPTAMSTSVQNRRPDALLSDKSHRESTAHPAGRSIGSGLAGWQAGKAGRRPTMRPPTLARFVIAICTSRRSCLPAPNAATSADLEVATNCHHEPAVRLRTVILSPAQSIRRYTLG